MRKALTALVCAVGMAGLAACDGTDDTTTQSLETEEPALMEQDPGMDDGTTQGLDPSPPASDPDTAQ